MLAVEHLEKSCRVAWSPLKKSGGRLTSHRAFLHPRFFPGDPGPGGTGNCHHAVSSTGELKTLKGKVSPRGLENPKALRTLPSNKQVLILALSLLGSVTLEVV